MDNSVAQLLEKANKYDEAKAKHNAQYWTEAET